MNYKEKLKNINTFIFDYDGVLTDGTVIIFPNGDAVRSANVKDGYALQLLVKLGYRVAIISGGYSESIKKRTEMLNIEDVYLGVANKLEVYRELVEKYNLKNEQILYMGDDIPDIEVLKEVGLSTCPADAATEIKEVVDYISFYTGGKGCVRDIIEQALKIHGKWMKQSTFNW